MHGATCRLGIAAWFDRFAQSEVRCLAVLTSSLSEVDIDIDIGIFESSGVQSYARKEYVPSRRCADECCIRMSAAFL